MGEGGEIADALRPDNECQYADTYGGIQLALAATTIAADLVRTAGFGPPAVCQSLDLSAAAISDRGMGI